MTATVARLALVLAAATLVTACGVHLHSPENAKRARAALDGYEKLKVDSVVATGRANMAELSKAQLETRQRVTEVTLKANLANVIGPGAPATDMGRQPEVLGWRKVVSDTREALRPFAFLEKENYSAAGLADSRAIRYRGMTEREIGHELRVYRDLVEEYRAGRTPGTQDTACMTVLAIRRGPRPAPEPERKWGHYTTFIGAACDRIAVLEVDLKRADDTMKRHPVYADIVDEIDTLERELKLTDDQAKELLQKLDAAKKALAAAEEEAAKRTVPQQTEAAKAELAKAQEPLAAAVKAIEGVVDASRGAAELVQVQIKTDVLETILSNAKALSGDAKATAAKPTQQLLTILKKYPDVAGRLKAAELPPVNVLVLELAIQRLHYRRLQAGRDLRRDIVAIRKLQRDALTQSTAAWIVVMDGLIRVRGQQPALEANLIEAFGSAPPATREVVAEILAGYGTARLATEDRMNLLNARLRDRYRAQSLDMTEIAVGAWSDLIRAPLTEITAYHEGGITSRGAGAPGECARDHGDRRGGVSMRTTARTVTRAVVITLVLSTTGCTTHAVVRDATRTVAGHVDQLSRALSEYARTLDADAAARVDRLAAQRRDLAALEAQLQARLTVWSIAGRDAEQRLYDGVLRATAETVAAERSLINREAQEAAALKERQAKFDTQTKELKSLTQQLSELAEPPGFKEQSAFLFDYFKSVGDEIRKLRKEADEAADKAAALPAGP